MDKRNGKTYRLWLTVLLCLAALALTVWGSVAIYTNQGFKKGVATTTQNDAMFSSNLLVQMSEKSTDNPDNFTQRQTTAPLLESTATLDFSIYNYAPNMPALVNGSDIEYTLTVKLVGDGITDVSGYTVKGESDPESFNNEKICTLSGFLNHNTKPNDENTYTITMPQADVGKVQFEVVAKADEGYKSAVNHMGLAAILRPSQSSGGTTAVGWNGRWVEAAQTGGPIPRDCALFNYEISGTGKGTVTLTCPTCFTIDPYFLAGLEYTKGSKETGETTYTFDVDADTQSVYNIRFYRESALTTAGYSEDSFKSWPTSLITFEKEEAEGEPTQP